MPPNFKPLSIPTESTSRQAMAHPDHDAVLDAFQREAARRGYPVPLGICHRAGDAGYTHIHGPNQPRRAKHCLTHAVGVEKVNGTVALRAPIGQQLGGVLRPDLPISRHPLGYSVGPFGAFGYGFDTPHIMRVWPTLDAFAGDVITAFVALGTW